MADINVERKGPSIWPWIIGLLVLALLIWAIAEMVDTGDQVEEVAEAPEVVEEPPAAVPAPVPMEPGAVRELGDLMPLGPEDVGQPVVISGEVVGVPTSQGFWVESQTEPNQVFFVRAPARTEDGEMIQLTELRAGDDVRVVGTVDRFPEGEAATQIEQAQLRMSDDFAQWTVHQDLLIGGTPAGVPTQPQQREMQQPGAQQPGVQQPGAPQRP